MRIRRLQTRIIILFVALLALVQVAAFWFVNAANSNNAHAKIEEELKVGQRVFARLLDQNADKLKLSARVLAADFAFREAIGTIASVLANHGARIGADAMVFVDLDGNVVSDTLQSRWCSWTSTATWSPTRCSRAPSRAASNTPRCSRPTTTTRRRAWKCSTVADSSWSRYRCSRRCRS